MLGLSKVGLFVVFMIMLQFDLNHYQFSAGRFVRETQKDCKLASTPGTARHFKEIFIGRCHYYLEVFRKNECGYDRDCNAIWEEFANATLYGTAHVDDYTKLLDMTDQNIEPNTSIFWSGTYMETSEYAKVTSKWAMARTFTGYLIDDLVFCVKDHEWDLDNPKCYADKQYFTFWNAASKRFAEKSSGTVLLILNGTRATGAIVKESTFNNYELPNFGKNVEKIRVKLLHRPGLQRHETCETSPSLKELHETLKTKNIGYECFDTPRTFKHLLCFQNQENCQYDSEFFGIGSADDSNSSRTVARVESKTPPAATTKKPNSSTQSSLVKVDDKTYRIESNSGRIVNIIQIY